MPFKRISKLIIVHLLVIGILLYLSNQSLPDINLAVSFLCTIVRDTDTDYYKKSLQGYQFHCFSDIIIGIHEDDIPSYILSERSLQVKIEKKK